MPIMEELLYQKSTRKTRAPNKPLCLSKIELDYAYAQLKLTEETSKHCNFAIAA